MGIEDKSLVLKDHRDFVLVVCRGRTFVVLLSPNMSSFPEYLMNSSTYEGDNVSFGLSTCSIFPVLRDKPEDKWLIASD